MKKRQIPCKMRSYSSQANNNLMKVTLYVMSDGKNYNGSSFDLLSMNDAEESIKNTPILAFLVQDEDGNVVDFDGHNMDTKLVNGEDGYELKTIYHERPIGIIPESCNPRYEKIDGKTFFVVDGWIWKSYSNGSYKIIEENDSTSVSMEIRVDDGLYNEDNDVYEIKKYRYEGVTVLGANVPPAIEGSKIMKYSSSEVDNKAMLESIYKEIYKIESEVSNLPTDCVAETTTEFEESKKKLDDENVVIKEEETPPVDDSELSEQEGSEVQEEENVETDTVDEFAEKKKDEEEEEVEEEEEEKVKKKEEDEDDEEEEYKKKRKCSIEEFSLDCFSVFFEEVPSTLEEVCSALVEKFNALNDELNTLKEFKANYDKSVLEQEVNNIVEEFSFEEEEVSDLRTKALNGEISTKEFKKELFALEGMKMHENKKKFSAKKEETSVRISVPSGITKYEPYGDLFRKYRK